MIKNPLQIYKLGEPLDYYYYDNQKEWMPIEVKTNDVLFFPGWLTHKTEKNLSDEHRYVMSLNIMGNYV
jgi:ectoine hydroxylase-related dioxygenase (phytanoyl-CoA dioxygenase family)